MSIWLLPLTFLLSLSLTALLRRYALARSLLDIPNARSSHSLPTPRGGGVAIVVSFCAALPLLWQAGLLATDALIALIGAGVLVAVIGFIDDHQHIAARWRLLGHFTAAFWLLGWLGGLPPLALPGFTLDCGWLGYPLGAVALVWLLNLYNFMDGIDGIASVEALTCCCSAALLYALYGPAEASLLPLLLASAVAGFLLWNFPPAKIFMGDAGSGFLGILLGALLLQAAQLRPELLWSWLILLAVFIVDATLTLLRRLQRGEKLHEAHRSHAYQYASRYYGRHLPVTLAVLVINLFWLLPLALLVAAGWLWGLLGLLIACIPLLALALRFRAGLPEQRS